MCTVIRVNNKSWVMRMQCLGLTFNHGHVCTVLKVDLSQNECGCIAWS